MLRTLKVAHRQAVKFKTPAANQLHALVMIAPEQLRADLRRISARRLARKASRLRCGSELADSTAATKFALRSVARRYLRLSEEIAALKEQIERLVKQMFPELVTLEGVGPDSDTAATIIIVAA